ncbi:hypothetical protein [Fibrobacter succinogenes]|uniref:hypothetical protein n=1 Tax=Fibrobacter succinogenes TaxID=833 RepID=UPI0013D14601|nr:hypothetical protein [Fibrobacter succinogenes]
MARGILWIVLTVCALLVAGCSSVMRPPSAAAFMDSYEQDKPVVNMNGALYGGDLDNDNARSEEWVFDATGSVFWNKSFFSLGFGTQTVTPFTQLGIVSPYFGVTAWSSIYSPFNIANYMSDNFWKDVSLGAMVVEQIPVGNKVKIGVTEHFSRNGIEKYLSDAKEGFMAFSFPEPHPAFYREVGGGAFVSYKRESSTLAFEFRYGRDIDNRCNRFAVMIDFWGVATKEFIYDKEKEREKRIKLQRETKAAEERQKERDLESLEEYEKRQRDEEE